MNKDIKSKQEKEFEYFDKIEEIAASFQKKNPIIKKGILVEHSLMGALLAAYFIGKADGVNETKNITTK